MLNRLDGYDVTATELDNFLAGLTAPVFDVEVIKKENISLIGINKSIEVPINLDEVIKQLTERFNINVNLDEIPNKTALQLQQEYNNKVLGRWQ